MFFSPGFNFSFLRTTQEIIWVKSVSAMTYLVSSGTLNLNQSINEASIDCFVIFLVMVLLKLSKFLHVGLC